MNKIKLENRTLVALAIMIGLMFISRSHSPFAGVHMPDFTIPALFIAGVYFRQWLVPVILIVAAVAIDNFAILYQGVSANCITPAYSVLPISYLAVYWGGTKIDSLAFKKPNQFIKVITLVIGFTAVQWFIATTSYYAFITAPWADFASYASQWVLLETLPVLYWMALISVVFTANQYLSLFNYFKPAKA